MPAELSIDASEAAFSSTSHSQAGNAGTMALRKGLVISVLLQSREKHPLTAKCICIRYGSLS